MLIESAEQNLNAFTQDPNNPQKNLDLNVGKWTNEENLKYAIFMDFHKQTLSSRQKKKDFKVFQEMSKFIASRNTVQCRSHHQKLQERFKHFKKIISAVKNQMGRKQYKAEFKKWTNNGEGLVIEEPKLKENSEFTEVLTKKEHIQQKIVDVQEQVKKSHSVGAESIYPLMGYQTFYNPFAYPFQNIYPFPRQYY